MKNLLDFTLISVGLLAIAGLVFGDGDRSNYRSPVSTPKSPAYVSECGSCHMAYPPALLPARSWAALMTGLSDHFGDNAELSADSAAQIRNYLVSNAADHATACRASAFARSVPGDQTPLRITDTPYFKRRHDEVPLSVVKKVPEIGSFSNCQACHRGAQAGSFSEHAVRIPGYGRWDD